MKKTIAALALGAILIPAAVIAGSQHGEYRSEKRVERMTEQLQLTDQQRIEIEKIFKEQHAKRRALHEQTREQVSNVLTPEQQAKWQQYKEDRKKRHCDRGGKGHGHENNDKG